MTKSQTSTGRGSADDALLAEVESAIAALPGVEPSRLIVSGERGVVVLDGDVDLPVQRLAIDQAVRDVPGVRAIVDHIVVLPPDPRTERLRDAIEEALETRADRVADRLEIIVHGGDVILCGTVHSEGEKRAVIGAVRATHQARTIWDGLEVDLHEERRSS